MERSFRKMGSRRLIYKEELESDPKDSKRGKGRGGLRDREAGCMFCSKNEIWCLFFESMSFYQLNY